MTKARQAIPPLDLTNKNRSGIRIETTMPEDKTVTVTICSLGEGMMRLLTAQQTRDVAASLVQRADLIDPPSRRKLGDVPRTPSEILGEFLRTTRELSRRALDNDPEHHHRVLHLCDQFAVVALMAALENAAPDVAAHVAETLADAWEDGGSIDEFLYEWREAHAAGRPIGFNPPPTLPLDVARIE